MEECNVCFESFLYLHHCKYCTFVQCIECVKKMSTVLYTKNKHVNMILKCPQCRIMVKYNINDLKKSIFEFVFNHGVFDIYLGQKTNIIFVRIKDIDNNIYSMISIINVE